MDTDRHGLIIEPRMGIVGACVGLFLLGVVVFQVHGQQYASQEGHALDANPGIGTFGLNVERRFDPLVPRVNLYITGNVRGGGRFQGLIPYRSVQELNLNLGSSTLSNFRRDSTGVSDLGRGVGGAARPWVDASRQVTRSSGGTIINTYRVHQQPRGVHPALERGGGNTRLAVRPFSLRSYSLNVDVGSQGYGPNPYTWAGGLYQMAPLEGVEAGNTFAEILQQERLGSPIDTRPLLGATRNDAAIRDGSEINLKQEGPASQVQQMLEELREAIPGALEFPREEISENSRGTGEQVRGELPPSEVKRIVGVVAPAISYIKQAQAVKYIERGEALMRAGSYYQAAEAFGTAAIYAGHRVEVLQAKAHALFAAGEFMSSAYYVDRAIRMSEQKTKERIDLRGLFKDTESFEKRLEDLNRWYERTEHKTLLFLKGYVHYQMGEVAEARAALAEVQQGQPSMGSAKVMLEWLDGSDP